MAAARGAWKKFGRINGSDLGRLAIKVYICTSCGAWWERMPPTQCTCGMLAFDKFDSKGEAKRWSTLLMLQRAGEISDLERQVRFPLKTVGPTGAPIQFATYVADYVYTENGQRVVEDHKARSGIDPAAALKLRCMEAAGIIVKLTS